jgi:hypothetical protein
MGYTRVAASQPGFLPAGTMNTVPPSFGQVGYEFIGRRIFAMMQALEITLEILSSFR